MEKYDPGPSPVAVFRFLNNTFKRLSSRNSLVCKGLGSQILSQATLVSVSGDNSDFESSASTNIIICLIRRHMGTVSVSDDSITQAIFCLS